jgi:hypothetical protein
MMTGAVAASYTVQARITSRIAGRGIKNGQRCPSLTNHFS